jgi:hypothetical protein
MQGKSRLERLGTPADVLRDEIIAEQAAALGRLGRGLEAALQALRDFDAEQSAPPPDPDKKHRTTLVTEAGHALWLLVVQREACGLRDSRAVIRDYGVPPEVQMRMDLLPAAPSPQKRRRR